MNDTPTPENEPRANATPGGNRGDDPARLSNADSREPSPPPIPESARAPLEPAPIPLPEAARAPLEPAPFPPQGGTPSGPPASVPNSSSVSSTDDAPGLMRSMELLLRRPAELLGRMEGGAGAGRSTALLAVGMLGALAVFGFLLGTFSMGDQLWAAPLKVAAGVLFSGLICLPSLYIFSCLNGLEIRLSALAGLLVAALCLTALVLLGFAPVVWVFAQSTDSVVFMGTLALIFWLIALLFGLNLIRQAAARLGVVRRTHLRLWSLVFLLVTLQMSTSLRPIIGRAETILPTEKKSFLVHWADSLLAPSRAGKEDDRDRGYSTRPGGLPDEAAITVETTR